MAAEQAVLARVGGAEVTVEEIRSALAGLGENDQAAIAKDPAVLNQVVRTLLVQRLVLKEALTKDWDKQPSVLAQLDRLRDGVIAESYLQAMSKVPTGYPSEAEMQAAYEMNKGSLVMPRQFRVAQIYIACPKGGDQAAEEKAKAKLDAATKSLAKPGASFEAIARAQSEEKDSAERGGEIGWIAENKLLPAIQSQVVGLAKGAVSEPIRLDDGWHILKNMDIKESHTASLYEVRAQLIQQMRVEKARSERQAYLAKLLQQSPIAINELALSKVLDKAEK